MTMKGWMLQRQKQLMRTMHSLTLEIFYPQSSLNSSAFDLRIKDNIGKGLTRICHPVYFNEPLRCKNVSKIWSMHIFLNRHMNEEKEVIALWKDVI